MNCPKCKGKSTVKDSSFNKDDDEYSRKRECKSCGHIFYTIEFEVPCDDVFKGNWIKHHRSGGGNKYFKS